MRFGGVFIGIFVAALAAVFVLQGGEQAPVPAPAPQITAQPEAVNTVNVYVAREFIPIGTVITDNMLMVQPWPEHLMVSSFALADGKTQVAGMVSRGFFQPQEPIINSKLVNANDPSFVAGNLPAGMRVITLRTDEIQGLSGFLSPGDRVDVLLTRDVQDRIYIDPEDNRQPREFAITETILTDARVIAVNQRTRAGKEREEGILGAAARQPQRYDPPRTVSLAVKPRDAQRLRLAEKVGEVSLTLRGIEDQNQTDDLGITFVNDISRYAAIEVGQAPEVEEEIAATTSKSPNFVTVVRGTEIEDKQAKKRQLDLEEGIASLNTASAEGLVAVSRGVLPQAAAVQAAE